MEGMNTLEDVYEATGGFGRFQIFVASTILLPELPSGMLDMLPIFTGANPVSWTCTDFNGTITDVTNDKDSLCNCNGTLYGGDSTIVSEWDLVCDYDWVTDFITSIQMAGMMCGDISGTIVADWFGRKRSLYLYCLIILTSGIISGFANSPYTYAIARFFVGAGISAYLILGSFYPMEFLTPKWRSISGAAGPWGEGVMTLSLIAYFVKPWRLLCWVTALPILLIFLTYPCLPESPRWLLLNKKVPEAKKVLTQVALWNRKAPVDDSVIHKIAKGFAEQQEDDGSIGILRFFQTSSLRKKTIIFMFVWFTCCLIYYGIGFNIKNLSGDPYWNVFYMALVDIVGFRSAIFVNKWLGRRKSFFWYMGTSSLALICIVVMQLNIGIIPKHDGAMNVLSFVAKMCAAGSLAVIECFTAESYPTTVRSTGIGFANGAASFGAIIAPQMAYLGSTSKSAPFFVFAFFAVVSTGMTLLLTETNGKPISENIEFGVTLKDFTVRHNKKSIHQT